MSFAQAMMMAGWLGLLVSISPCPLTGNVVALSYLARRIDRPASVLASGLLFVLGQVFVYVVLAGAIARMLLAREQVAFLLQHYLSAFLGPLLIVIGVILLELLPLRLKIDVAGRLSQRPGRVPALLLGIALALGFCPTTAALYFGQLLPLAISNKSPVILPALFAAGASLPVLIFAWLLAFATNRIGSLFQRLSSLERAARLVTGLVFIVAGIYLTFVHIYNN